MSVKGWVYIITNRAMPGLVKVGYSMKDPSLRAAELNHTGNPHPYDVRYECLVKNPRDVEQTTHRRLVSHREGKEWFRCEIPAAIHQIRNAAGDTLILENSFSGERGLLEQAREKIRELEAKMELVQSKEYLFQEAIDGDDTEWTKCLARYSKWSPELITELYNSDSQWQYSEVLAGNPSTPPDIINELVNECLSDDVFESALANPNCDSRTIAQIVWLTDFKLLITAENNPNYSKETLLDFLHEMASDSDWQARSWVAESRICRPDTLRLLAKDKIPAVREYVAANAECPLDVIYSLSRDSDEDVRIAAANNPSHPKNFDEPRLCELLEDDKTPSFILESFVANPSYSVRKAIALNPSCPESLLAVLADDSEIRVRIAAKHRISA